MTIETPRNKAKSALIDAIRHAIDATPRFLTEEEIRACLKQGYEIAIGKDIIIKEVEHDNTN